MLGFSVRLVGDKAVVMTHSGKCVEVDPDNNLVVNGCSMRKTSQHVSLEAWANSQDVAMDLLEPFTRQEASIVSFVNSDGTFWSGKIYEEK